MRLPLFVVALMLPASLSAQTDWTSASKVDVTLANFKYEPRVIRLPAGRPVTLHLVNSASGGHDFTARRFFAEAQVRPEDRAAIEKGSVELAGHQSRDISLVPKVGRYPLKCGHTFHEMFGMSGEIIVE